MKIYIATYEDGSGRGYQKVCKDKLSAKTWLRERFIKDNDPFETEKEFEDVFKDHCEYGAWTGKIRMFNV